MNPSPPRKTVIIVGGGFGGLYAARTLANTSLDVILIDKKNHHTFQPLLYQVALAVLSPAEIASPLRHILRKARNIRVLLGEVVAFDLTARTVHLAEGGSLSFDYLIVAAGARHAYFGHDEWAKDAPGLKTIEDAVEIRRRLLLAFETAEREALLTGTVRPLNFAIVGGGPTGVELAGAIADLARMALARDFKAIDTRKANVRLYEGASRILGTYSEESSRSATRQLTEMGVEVCTGRFVTAVEPGRIKLGEEWVDADVALWASGVAASPLGTKLSSEVDKAGRVKVEPDLSLPGDRNVFVVGDMVSLTDASGQVVPGLAAAAIQEGESAAKNILRDLRGQDRIPFEYVDKGSMATIGYKRAIAEFGGRKFSGYIAWLLWSLVHVFLLIGFRNRIAVMIQWLWAYIRRQGNSPLITEHHRPPLSQGQMETGPISSPP